MVERVAKAICKVNRGYECYARPFQPYGLPPEPAIRTCGCGDWEENEEKAHAAISEIERTHETVERQSES